jgi:Predicted integral membrane protein
MEEEPRSALVFRFGVFEADLASGELRKQGSKIRLQEQPFRILVMLLDRAGKVVSREEICRNLWPPDTFVDFEQGVGTAIKKLRQALHDDAETPRYIETLPKRGYRFIAAVEKAGDPALLPNASAPSAQVLQLSSATPEFAATEAVGSPSEVSTIPKHVVLSRRVRILALAAVLLTALGTWLAVDGVRIWQQRQLGARRIESLAVLPLENVSGDQQQDYFADGMTDQLIASLARVGALRVISRTSVMHYKGSRKTLPEVARELNVDAVVEGTVMRSGDRVRISVQLIQAATEKHLWGETYERDLRDILVLQSWAVRTITDQIRIKLTSEERAQLAKTRPVDPEAYEAYLKGLQNLAKFTPESCQKAIDWFRQASAKDPEYALTYDGLAYSYIVQSNWPLAPSASMPEARKAAQKALDLDDALPGAHTSLAIVLFAWDWDRLAAEREVKRALQLNPNYARAYWVRAWLSRAIGRFDEAISDNEAARRLDPLAMESSILLGSTLYYARRYDQAIQQFRNVLDMHSENWLARLYLGLAYQQKGRLTAALGEFERAKATAGPVPDILGPLGFAYALSGKQDEARTTLAELKRQAETAYTPAYNMALVCIGLDDKDQAFAWLEKAYAEHSGILTELRNDPNLDGLRSEPRFRNLIGRVGLPL